mgnify:CR=1 FL=1|jgi:hypothetical protein|nr:MAG TPA: hypothetical protein [Caudoviricetes sp.]
MASSGSTWRVGGKRKSGGASSAKARRKIYLRSADFFNPAVYDASRKKIKRYRELPDLPF